MFPSTFRYADARADARVVSGTGFLGIFNNNACQESSRHLASATFGASQYRGTMYPLTAAVWMALYRSTAEQKEPRKRIGNDRVAGTGTITWDFVGIKLHCRRV